MKLNRTCLIIANYSSLSPHSVNHLIDHLLIRIKEPLLFYDLCDEGASDYKCLQLLAQSVTFNSERSNNSNTGGGVPNASASFRTILIPSPLVSKNRPLRSGAS